MNTTPELACAGAGNVVAARPEGDRLWTPRRIAAVAAAVGTGILTASCGHHPFMEYGQPAQVSDQFSLPDLSTSSVQELLEHQQTMQTPAEQV